MLRVELRSIVAPTMPLMVAFDEWLIFGVVKHTNGFPRLRSFSRRRSDVGPLPNAT